MKTGEIKKRELEKRCEVSRARAGWSPERERKQRGEGEREKEGVRKRDERGLSAGGGGNSRS